MPNDYDLLFVYDAEESGNAIARADADVKIGVTGGVAGFAREMDKLLAQGATFKRAIFDTHGDIGGILFGGKEKYSYVERSLDSYTLPAISTGKDYDRLFPRRASIYFNGCNVAEGLTGLEFLETAGKIFLRRMGGQVFGHSTPGYEIPDWVLILAGPLALHRFGGHVYHPSGGERYVYVLPGGAIAPPQPTIEVTDKSGEKFTVGNKL
jgi:hypothetical protein